MDIIQEIKGWSNEEVEQIFSYLMDELPFHKRQSIELIVSTTEQRREYLIESEKKFQNSFE